MLLRLAAFRQRRGHTQAGHARSKFANIRVFRYKYEKGQVRIDEDLQCHLLVPNDGGARVLLAHHRLNRLQHSQLVVEHDEFLIERKKICDCVLREELADTLLHAVDYSSLLIEPSRMF